MKRRWIALVIALAVFALCAALLWPASNSKERRAVAETRQALQQQGFKTDLSQFRFFTDEESRKREAFLLAVFAGQFESPVDMNLMSPVAPDSALVVWRQESLEGFTGEIQWKELRERMNKIRPRLDAARNAALAGPIRFNLDANAGHGLLLPHLSSVKNLSQMLSHRAVLALHDHDNEAAWKNLLASTRLVTAWQPESVEISHFVRFSCTAIAFNTAWQMLQENNWQDDQLAELQREWESVDFFKTLPETVAFSRVSAIAMCQLERHQPLSAGLTWKGIITSPASAWNELNYYWRQRAYRNRGTYEDEKALMLYYRNLEIETSKVVKSATWAEMRPLPGVTNKVPFQSKHSSRMQSLMNMRQISMRFQHDGSGLLGRAADSETRRRIILTAIALERYRRQHESYPKTLRELAPEFLARPLDDFMDGKPLRYRATPEGHFVLYSVGLDCVDNQGKMQARRNPSPIPRNLRNFTDTDLIWPRPASISEVTSFQEQQTKVLAARINQEEENWAREQWRHTANRQRGAEKLLATPLETSSTLPTYRGRSLVEIFQNLNVPGTNKFTPHDLLTLRQIITGNEPETVTFEVPIAYDVLTNLGELQLYIDPVADHDSDEGSRAGMQECNRATNGNCRLVWQTIYESPGQHALQLGLILNDPEKFDEDFHGPLAPFVITNFCQFSLSSAHFNPKIGATLSAKLPEANANYRVEITSATGGHLKTLAGNTSNGILKVHWDLTDDEGPRCTNDVFNTTFHITLPDSGRSQTMNGR